MNKATSNTLNSQFEVTTKFSIFKNLTSWVEDKTLPEIIDIIKSGKYKATVDKIRELVLDGKEKEADILKKRLDGLTTSGTFSKTRNGENISKYSQHVILDLDDIPIKDIENLFKAIIKIRYTVAAFISPSGKGIKIIVKVDSSVGSHKIAISEVAGYYESELEIHNKIDPKGKDLARLCFMSYHPDAFINLSATIFNVKPVTSLIQNGGVVKSLDAPVNQATPNWEDSLLYCRDFTEQKSNYSNGNRNNFLHLLSSNCNRNGIPQSIVEDFILQNYDLDRGEIISTVKSAYENNKEEFATFATFAEFASVKEERQESRDEILKNMPYFPENIYDILPTILNEGCGVFKDKREKDIFLIGSLAILSGCIPNVRGLYRGKEHYANLNVFVVAPPASFKSAIDYSKQLGDKYHERLRDESFRKRKIFEMELAEYKRQVAKSKDSVSNLEPPQEPPFKILFIPANSSYARLIQHLKEAEQGIFCETEADTMVNVLKQDWGNYSEILRKAFHHDRTTLSRKKDKEFIEIEKTRLSVLLSGTPNQVVGIFKSAEDGLVSRFIFYNFKSDSGWIKAGAEIDGINLTKYFEGLSERVLKLVDFLSQSGEITFILTNEQWEKLNEFGAESLKTLTTFVSEDMASISKRLGLILFRLAMILSALRNFDNAEITSEIVCSDEDFFIALEMAKVLQVHAEAIFKELPKSAKIIDKALKSFFEALPLKFKRNEAINIAWEKFTIKPRTADGYLARLVNNNFLDHTVPGYYEKK